MDRGVRRRRPTRITMTDLTFLARLVGGRRVAAARSWRGGGIMRAQLSQLSRLTRRMAHTVYGHTYGLTRTADYGLFRDTMPLTAYEDLRPWVMRMVGGEADVLWPGVTRRFAQSSGTSDGRSKFIPVTDASLRANHYRGAGDAVWHYLANYPDSRMFGGKGFILGGSFATALDTPPGVKAGDLSAHLIECVSPLVNLFRVPGKEVALMEDWTLKVPALVAASRNSDITNISGVPSWFLTVLRAVMADAGAATIHQVWPNLEVFFHGGIAMDPYRSQYAAITDPRRKMRYVETYNASEGFFAVQDLRQPGAMLLLLDAGVFYEFLPLDADGREVAAEAVPAWGVEEGRTYSLVITAPNGLCRYRIGDTVRIVSADPLRIAIAGRTKHFINAFGEEVMVYNTDAALTRTCARHNCHCLDYTVAPVFANGGRRGRHQWLVEWAKAPQDAAAFAADLDAALQEENSDYAAKRAGGIFLDPLTVTAAPRGLFDRWLATTGKLGGQRKIPRLSNDRRIMDTLLAMMTDGHATRGQSPTV